MKKEDKSKTTGEKFEALFKSFRYTDIKTIKGPGVRVSGKKLIQKENEGDIILSVYYYEAKEFRKKCEVDQGFITTDVSPCLVMYISGAGLLKYGLANIELKSIKYPHEEDLEKLEDYARCLLILLK